MLELLILYGVVCYFLIKKGIVAATGKNYGIMVGIGFTFLLIVFMAFRYYAFIDLTHSATVKSTTVSVRTPTGGEVDKIFVSSNQRVKKGDLLFTVDTSKYSSQFNQITSDIQTQQNSLDNLKKDFERTKQLKQGGYVSQAAYDKAYTNLMNQEQALMKSKGALENVEWFLTKSKIYSPVDGYTNIVYLSEGQYLPENRLGAFVIFTDKKFIEVRIPDLLYTFLEVGSYAEFYVSTHPGKVFRGRVQSIAQSTGEAQSNPTSLQGQNTSTLVVRGSKGLGRIVIIEFEEPEGVDIPVGANGQVFISARKPLHILGFVDILAAMVIRIGTIESYFKVF